MSLEDTVACIKSMIMTIIENSRGINMIMADQQYYKNIIVVNDASRVINYLLDRVVNYAPRVMPQFRWSL